MSHSNRVFPLSDRKKKKIHLHSTLDGQTGSGKTWTMLGDDESDETLGTLEERKKERKKERERDGWGLREKREK